MNVLKFIYIGGYGFLLFVRNWKSVSVFVIDTESEKERMGCGMVKNVRKGVFSQGQKAEPATTEDVAVAQDLLDTLRANENYCMGMSANMIGVNKRIIAINAGIVDMPMLNPRILNKTTPYEVRKIQRSAEDRTITRYDVIEVEYEDMDFNKKKQTFTGWLAHLIQNEIDRCEGEPVG